MDELPCDYRVPTNTVGKYFCRHTSVRSPGNMVRSAVCASCESRTRPCPSPREVSMLQSTPSPEFPSLGRQLHSFTHAVAAFAADQFQVVDRSVYLQRLAVCESCDLRREKRCLLCGCYLPAKAAARAFDCPEGFWPRLDDVDSTPADTAVQDE